MVSKIDGLKEDKRNIRNPYSLCSITILVKGAIVFVYFSSQKLCKII